MSARRQRRLFWRIYGYGLVMIVAVAGLVTLSARLVSGEPRWKQTPQRLRAALELELEHGGRVDRAALTRRLEQLADLLDVSLALYTLDGEAVAVAGPQPPGPLGVAEARALDAPQHDHEGWQWTATLRVESPDDAPLYLRAGHDSSEGALRFGVGLLVVLLASAAVLYPLARSLARPLERIAAAADELGRGQLDARSGVSRRDEIGALAEAFDRMAERLGHLVLSQRELLANVSHELRTPLSRIRVALELCEESERLEVLRRHLSGIAGDAAELDRLVEDVLVTARLDLAEQGVDGASFVLRTERVEAETLLDEAARRFTARHPGLSLALECAPELSRLEVDPMLMRRVLDNLLDNAAKYGAAPIALRVGAPAAEAAAGSVVFEVRDHGAGLSGADRERAFEPFFRADRSRAGATSGVGLGLTLCRRVVEAHGGTIALVAADPGTIARVRLPISGASREV